MPVLQMTALAVAGAALLATCLLLRALAGPRGAAARLLFLWLLAYAQIVLLSEALSELHLIGAGGFVVGHAMLFLTAFASWRRRGSPRLFVPVRDAVASAFLFVRRNRAVALFAAAVGLLAVANLAFPFLYPVLNGDANSYHLPRAYYWTTLGTARHFPTADFRMSEMPPDPSFVFAWVMALSGSFRGLHVPQWAAGLALSVAVGGLARLAGAGRAGSLLAGSLTATLPVALLQAGTAQTDLTAAAAGTAALYFGLRAAGEGERAVPDAIGFGIALGLALGTKLTVLFLLPGLAVAIVAVAWSRCRSEAPRRLAVLAALALGGFVFLGAYNYVLNVFDTGNPIASKRGFELTLANRPAWCYEKAPSVLKYLHQTLDWPGMERSPLNLLPHLQERTFEAAAGGLGLSFEMGEARSAIRDSRFVPDEEHSGFGPVGFVAFLLSPVVLLASAASWVKSRRPEALVRCLLVVTALGWFVGFVSSGQPWVAEVIRYFLMFIPLLVAALIAQGRQTRWGTAAAVLAAGVSLVADFAVTFQGPGGVRQGAYRAPGFAKRVSEEVIASLVETLPAEFPDGARIGIVSEYNDVVFHLFRSVPRISFVPVREIDVPDLLRSGRIDGAVIGQFRNEAGQGWTLPGIPVPRNMLVVPDPSRFFRAHPSQYGFEMGLREGRTAARIPLGREKRWESGTFHLRLPAELASALGGPLELVLPADRDLSVADTIEAQCHGVRAGVGVQGRALRVKIPTACANVDRVLMDLVLVRGPQAWPISFRGDAWVLGGPAGGEEVRGQTSGAQDGASASSPALIRRRIRGSFEEDFMNRRTSRIVAAGALAFGFVAARPLAARELAGVNLPDTMSAGENTLKLNGLGLRKKAIFKVYVGGLYLAAPSKDAAAIVAADAPKAVRMHFLRDLKKTQLTEGFSEGFEANAKEKAASQKASIDKMLALVPDVKEGETMSFVYVPGKGTTLYAGDKALGTFEGKVFADAVFSIWLGPKPPSEDLKKGMLG